MILNCDIGERGADHPVDLKLMSLVGLANIACGGHAGDKASVDCFRQLAVELGVQVSAHLSYPDRIHFGRVSMEMSWPECSKALEWQLDLLPGVTAVKFHGALYNDCVRDRDLAGHCADWLSQHGITTVVCPPDSEIAQAAASRHLDVLAEAFLERRYQQSADGRLELVPRTHPEACIETVTEALDQAKTLMEHHQVRTLDGTYLPLKADTFCIHSDSPIALDLAGAVARYLEEAP